MLSIKILGPSCYNCYLVERVAGAALEALMTDDPEIDATLQHVTDYAEMEKYGLQFTPGLVINEKLVCGGRIPSESEVTDWLRAAIKQGVVN
jgi:protein-disulfide isomerase